MAVSVFRLRYRYDDGNNQWGATLSGPPMLESEWEQLVHGMVSEIVAEKLERATDQAAHPEGLLSLREEEVHAKMDEKPPFGHALIRRH